jgi:hypothetical protein
MRKKRLKTMGCCQSKQKAKFLRLLHSLPPVGESEDLIAIAARHLLLSYDETNARFASFRALWVVMEPFFAPLKTVGFLDITARIVGSVKRMTALKDSDTDVLLVLSPGSTPSVSINKAVISVFYDACTKFSKAFPELRTTVFPNKSTVRLQITTEFGIVDVLPAIEVDDDVCYTLRNDGSWSWSDDRRMFYELRAFREFVACLKVVIGKEWTQPSLPSCMFETLALEVVKSVESWNEQSLTVLIRMALKELARRIRTGIRLPPPNSKNEDKLERIRGHPQVSVLLEWLDCEIDEIAILKSLMRAMRKMNLINE